LKSSLTSAIEPSGSTTPPCEVPDWTLIFEMPAMPFGKLRRNPFMYPRSSSTVLLCEPTSPISPPTEIVTPRGSSPRTSRRMSTPIS
jgi:hypothetical protein